MGLEPLIQAAARHRRAVLAVVLIVTAVLGVGLTRLRVGTSLLEWLPASHPNVEAFRDVFDSLGGAVNQELVWIELDPAGATAAGVTQISDHASLAAQDELIAHVRQRVPGVTGVFGVLPLVKLVHGLRSGSEPSLPASPAETAVLWRVLEAATGDLLEAIVADDGRGTILSFVLDVDRASPSSRDAGQALREAIRSYAEDPDRTHDLFVDDYLVPVGLNTGSTVIDESLRHALVMLTPFAAVFLLAMLQFLFGNWRVLVAVVAVLVLGFVWALGLMGWTGAPINIVTVSIVPLLLGCGVNYAILLSMEALDRRIEGTSAEQTLVKVSRSSATAIMLTTLTTVAGLLSLGLSDSPGIMQLGLHAAAGMAALAALALALLPGVVVGVPPRSRHRRGPVIAPLAASFARNRSVVLLVYAIGVAASVTLVREPVFLLDVLEGNYPADSAILRSVERMRERCGGTFPEIVIARGDLTSPRSLEAMDRVEDGLANSAELEDFEVVGATTILGMYSLVEKNDLLTMGIALAGHGGDPRKAAPRTPEEIRALVDKLHASPAWSTLAGMFISRDGRSGAILLLGGEAGTDMDTVEHTWGALESVIAAERREGDPIELSFLGYRTMSYLFATHSLASIRTVAVVTLIVVLTLSAFVLRRRRALLVVGTLMTTSCVVWFGLLQLLDIYVSIFLLFPLVFAVCVGSDYALHILCRLRADQADLGSGEAGDRIEWTRSAWNSTGRAIAFAAFTDGGVFLIYSLTPLVSASNVMVAVALAVAAIFACTVLLVPALIFPKSTVV